MYTVIIDNKRNLLYAVTLYGMLEDTWNKIVLSVKIRGSVLEYLYKCHNSIFSVQNILSLIALGLTRVHLLNPRNSMEPQGNPKEPHGYLNYIQLILYLL